VEWPDAGRAIPTGHFITHSREAVDEAMRTAAAAGGGTVVKAAAARRGGYFGGAATR
jgi:hypothetical protein